MKGTTKDSEQQTSAFGLDFVSRCLEVVLDDLSQLPALQALNLQAKDLKWFNNNRKPNHGLGKKRLRNDEIESEQADPVESTGSHCQAHASEANESGSRKAHGDLLLSVYQPKVRDGLLSDLKASHEFRIINDVVLIKLGLRISLKRNVLINTFLCCTNVKRDSLGSLFNIQPVHQVNASDPASSMAILHLWNPDEATEEFPLAAQQLRDILCSHLAGRCAGATASILVPIVGKAPLPNTEAKLLRVSNLLCEFGSRDIRTLEYAALEKSTQQIQTILSKKEDHFHDGCILEHQHVQFTAGIAALVANLGLSSKLRLFVTGFQSISGLRKCLSSEFEHIIHLINAVISGNVSCGDIHISFIQTGPIKKDDVDPLDLSTCLHELVGLNSDNPFFTNQPSAGNAEIALSMTKACSSKVCTIRSSSILAGQRSAQHLVYNACRMQAILNFVEERHVGSSDIVSLVQMESDPEAEFSLAALANPTVLPDELWDLLWNYVLPYQSVCDEITRALASLPDIRTISNVGYVDLKTHLFYDHVFKCTRSFSRLYPSHRILLSSNKTALLARTLVVRMTLNMIRHAVDLLGWNIDYNAESAQVA